MKKLMLFGILSLFMGIGYAQESISLSSITKDVSSTTWHILKQGEGVTISYQYVDCGPAEYLLFKIDNTTQQTSTVSFKFKLFDGQQEIETNPDDMHLSFTISAGTNISRTCNSGSIKLGVFVKEHNSSLLRFTALKISDLNISNTQ